MKFRHALIIVTVVFSLSSCNFFTTSVGKGLARDNSNIYSGQSSSDLVSLASSPEAINDPESSSKILEALGDKSDEELRGLSGDDKNTVLNLMVGNTITSDTMSDILEEVQNINSRPLEDVVDGMLENIEITDTRAVASLLHDETSLSQIDPKTGCLAALCLIAQVAKGDGDLSIDSDSCRQAITDSIGTGAPDTDSLATSLASSMNIESPESVNALKSALFCVNYFKDSDEEVFGGKSINDILNAFAGN